MDEVLLNECKTLTKTLSEDENAWPFLEPVDPVAQNCPTYFEVIANPMDLGTIKTKLENNSYESFEAYVDDVRLVFSNCLLFNKGNQSRGIRKMAMSLRSRFEKLLTSIIKRNRDLFVDQEPAKQIWIQCDTCLKWRSIKTKGNAPYRYKCGDLNSPYTCSTPQEPRPTPKAINDGNSIFTVINSIITQGEKRPVQFNENQLYTCKEDIKGELFYRFLISQWACSPEFCSSYSEISTNLEMLGVDAYIIYSCVKRNNKRWKAIQKELCQTNPQLNDEEKFSMVKEMYLKYIEPFEEKWVDLKYHEESSLSELCRSKRRKIMNSNECMICHKPFEENKEKYTCIFCNSSCCVSCYKGRPQEAQSFICKKCQQIVSASWGELPVCIKCGLDIINPVIGKNCHSCQYCDGLVHTVCNKEYTGNPKEWICKNCKEIQNPPNTILSCHIDSETRYIVPCVCSI